MLHQPTGRSATRARRTRPHRPQLVNRLACLALAAWASWATYADRAFSAETVVYRSLRTEQHLRLDARKLPPQAIRPSHLGWEVRTKHFVVLATSSPELASEAARQLESTWARIGHLADHWTDVHRRPSFGMGAVSVVLTDRLPNPGARPAEGPRPLNDEAVIFLSVPRGARDLGADLPALKREALFAFLRVAQQDHVIPAWVQTGLADYIAGEQPDADTMKRLPLPSMTPPQRDGHRVQRETTEVPRLDRTAAALWVGYLLEGDDAVHAPAFLAALAAVAPSRPVAEVALGRRWGSVMEGDGPASSHWLSEGVGPLADLVTQVASTGRTRRWLEDRQTGQPIVRTEPEELSIGPIERQMVFLLKLSRRFSPGHAHRTTARILEEGRERSAPRAEVPAPIDLADLQRRLSDPDAPAWATLDADGTLLFSTDRARLAALFADARRRIRTAERDGKPALESTLPDGARVEAWIEENPDHPERPIVHVKRLVRSAPGPRTVAPSAPMDEPTGSVLRVRR